MGKKKNKKKQQSINLPVIPIILVLAAFWAFNFINTQSAMNMNKRNDALTEARLTKENYPYLNDIQYKKAIIKNTKKYSLFDLNSIMGAEELKHYIEKYNDDYSNYAFGQYNPGNKAHINQKKLRANLNIHTPITDGNIEIVDILNQSLEYANELAKEYPDEKYIIAFTDLNTVENAKKILDIITKDPIKYKNLKIVFGIEIPTTLESNDIVKETSKVNLLVYGINPFDKTILKKFPKLGLINSYDDDDKDFKEVTDFLNEQKNIIYGIAKPLQKLSSINNTYQYLDNLLEYYSIVNPNFKFIEAYYDPYIYGRTSESIYLEKIADSYKIYKVGSLEPNNENIFKSY